jgi:hypothetical protein
MIMLIYIRNIDSISIGLNGWWLKIFKKVWWLSDLGALIYYLCATFIPTYDRNDISQ